MKVCQRGLFFTSLLFGALWLSTSNIAYADICEAATSNKCRYIDSAVAVSGDGTSWSTAWKNLSDVKGISDGYFVYLSGGPAGSSKTYVVTDWWQPAGGTSNVATYKIGQDAAHKGEVVFSGTGTWLGFALKNVVISGDAGDGNMHFQVTGYATTISGANDSNVRISYVNFGQIGGGMDFNPVSGLEFDHNYVYVVNPTADHFVYANFLGTSWDNSKIHDNTVYLPRSSDGTGADGFQTGGAGYSIYNNTIIGFTTNYTGGQHQDGWQATGGDYIKIYGNRFVNIANYPIFGDSYDADFNHLWIYNNVLSLTDSALQSSAPPQGIAVGPDGGSYSKLGRWPVFTDVLIANNIIVDYGGHTGIALYHPGTTSATFNGCFVANNIIINGGAPLLDGAVSDKNNVVLASNAATSGHFLNYVQNGSNNDFHLLGSDTTFRDKGTSEAAYFGVDKDGVVRPQGSAWDIGPYEYSAGLAPAPAPPTSLRIN